MREKNWYVVSAVGTFVVQHLFSGIKPRVKELIMVIGLSGVQFGL